MNLLLTGLIVFGIGISVIGLLHVFILCFIIPRILGSINSKIQEKGGLIDNGKA